MSFTKQVKQTLQKEAKKVKDKDYDYSALFRERVLEQRRRKVSVVKVDKPTNLPRARSLGYKAKKGFIVAVVRVRKGSGTFERPAKGRRPKRMGVSKLTRRENRKGMAEKRAGKKYPNCEVLNSYWVGADGKHSYYEVILVDVASPEIRADKERKWIVYSKHTKRAERGLTSSGRKSRGLKKGKGHEKNFPSLRANQRKAK